MISYLKHLVGAFLVSTVCFATALAQVGVPAEAAQHEFYEVHMRHVVEDWFINGQHPIPEVRKLFENLRARVQKVYSKDLSLSLVSVYDSRGPSVSATSGLVSEAPDAAFIIPVMMERYKTCQSENSARAEQLFENFLSIDIVHELDHLAYGLVATGNESNDVMDALEAEAWAHTCEEAIRVYIEKSRPLPQGTLMYYLAWVGSGRDKSSPVWKKFIKDAHAEIRHSK